MTTQLARSLAFLIAPSLTLLFKSSSGTSRQRSPALGLDFGLKLIPAPLKAKICTEAPDEAIAIPDAAARAMHTPQEFRNAVLYNNAPVGVWVFWLRHIHRGASSAAYD
ncbi:hypothetical protein ASPCAL14468 [Aspergillus calidoustus]|uniref:Uncharacterized protein n=1 Tax=Aspergillus calidoustus TaxID=454130 RepID=A0A0U4ZPV8_ASPCI|nr:hypothetical protein ASPCAL14468 [Aspergillus calidoustus]